MFCYWSVEGTWEGADVLCAYASRDQHICSIHATIILCCTAHEKLLLCSCSASFMLNYAHFCVRSTFQSLLMRGCLTTAASIFVLCTAYLGSIVDHTHCAIRPRASMGGTEKVMLQNLLIASIMRLSDLLK